MNSVRVTYAGLISWIVLLIGIFTGLAFTIIVTRRLTPEEFGLWNLIGGILIYALIFQPISAFWVTRHVARNEEATVTGIGSSLLFSFVAMAIYLGISFVIASNADVDLNIILLAAILIPFTYINTTLRASIIGYKPQGSSYGILIFEFTKIPLGFILVYWMDIGIIGAIYTIFVSQITQATFSLYYAREKLREKFHFFRLKKWTKISWLSMFNSVPDRILHLDVTIFTIFTGSATNLAYIGVARSIAQLVSNTSALSSALYPKLLQSGKEEYIKIVFKRTLLFTIPITALAIIFTKAGLWILNPLYIDGVYIVYTFIIIHFSYVIAGILGTALTGLEKVDVNQDSKLKDYIKSKLFTVPLVRVFGRASYIIMLVAVLFIASNLETPDLEMLVWWGLVGIISNVGVVLMYIIMTRNNLHFKFPYKNIVKYIIATVVSSLVLISVMDQNLEFHESIFIFLPNLIPYLLLFIGIYSGIMLGWDKDAREFLKLVIREFKK